MDIPLSDLALVGEEALHTAWIFQGLGTLPVLITLVAAFFDQVFYPYIDLYRFMYVVFLPVRLQFSWFSCSHTIIMICTPTDMAGW
jgi:hypothetical protein